MHVEHTYILYILLLLYIHMICMRVACRLCQNYSKIRLSTVQGPAAEERILFYFMILYK